jgi:hypothetical protein
VVQVLGTDNIPRVENKLNQGLWIFVHNRPNLTEFDLEKWLSEDRVKNLLEKNVIIVRDEKVPIEMSSTIIRERINNQESIEQYVPEAVQKWHIEKKIVYPVKKEEKKEEQPKEEMGPLEGFLDFKATNIGFDELTMEYKDNVPWKLGQGLQAKVWAQNYKGTHLAAVKTFDFDQKGSARGRKIATFVRELQCLTALNHNNIVKCFGAGTHKRLMYIVLERGQPINIWNYLQEQRKIWPKDKPMPAEWVRAWAELAEGCHEMTLN